MAATAARTSRPSAMTKKSNNNNNARFQANLEVVRNILRGNIDTRIKQQLNSKNENTNKQKLEEIADTLITFLNEGQEKSAEIANLDPQDYLIHIKKHMEGVALRLTEKEIEAIDNEVRSSSNFTRQLDAKAKREELKNKKRAEYNSVFDSVISEDCNKEKLLDSSYFFENYMIPYFNNYIIEINVAINNLVGKSVNRIPTKLSELIDKAKDKKAKLSVEEIAKFTEYAFLLAQQISYIHYFYLITKLINTYMIETKSKSCHKSFKQQYDKLIAKLQTDTQPNNLKTSRVSMKNISLAHLSERNIRSLHVTKEKSSSSSNKNEFEYNFELHNYLSFRKSLDQINNNLNGWKNQIRGLIIKCLKMMTDLGKYGHSEHSYNPNEISIKVADFLNKYFREQEEIKELERQKREAMQKRESKIEETPLSVKEPIHVEPASAADANVNEPDRISMISTNSETKKRHGTWIGDKQVLSFNVNKSIMNLLGLRQKSDGVVIPDSETSSLVEEASPAKIEDNQTKNNKKTKKESRLTSFFGRSKNSHQKTSKQKTHITTNNK